jgi:hypothetical protein
MYVWVGGWVLGWVRMSATLVHHHHVTLVVLAAAQHVEEPVLKSLHASLQRVCYVI